MAKLTMVCPTPIHQFIVQEAGLYAWRNIAVPKSELDKAWFFGELKVGDKIDGQYEGTGPITWKTIDQSQDDTIERNLLRLQILHLEDENRRLKDALTFLRS